MRVLVHGKRDHLFTQVENLTAGDLRRSISAKEGTDWEVINIRYAGQYITRKQLEDISLRDIFSGFSCNDEIELFVDFVEETDVLIYLRDSTYAKTICETVSGKTSFDDVTQRLVNRQLAVNRERGSVILYNDEDAVEVAKELSLASLAAAVNDDEVQLTFFMLSDGHLRVWLPDQDVRRLKARLNA